MDTEIIRNLQAPFDGIRVISCPHPFSVERIDLAIPEGGTIGDILRLVNSYPSAGLNAHVFLGDLLIIREEWEFIKPGAGDTVTVRVVPTDPGGGGAGKIFRTILSIAVIAVGGFVGLAVAGAIGGTFGAVVGSIAGAAVNFVGSLIVNAIAPPPRPKLGRLSGTSGSGSGLLAESPTLAITGGQNRANNFGAIPRLFGKHRIFPTLGAQTFTEIVGNDQFLRQLFTIGYGPVQMTDMRIGDTPISQFEGVETQTREGLSGDSAIGLFSNDVREDALSIRLKAEDGWRTQRSQIDADELSVDIVFANGLVEFEDDGTKIERTVSVSVEYQPASGGGWTSAGTITVTEKKSSLVRRGLRWTVSKNQYDVRLKRTTADTEDAQIRDEVFWSTLRTIKHVDPITISGMAKVALRIKATDQLNGVVDRFNLLVEAKLPTWNGSAWTSPVVTRRAAWAYAEVLRGAANKRALADSRIDGDGLKAWADADATAGRNFDAVMDFRSTVFESLRDIAASARASFAMKDGKYSVVTDVVQTTIIQHFTPRNSTGYKGRKAFNDVPHGLKVRFINADKDYQQDERLVFDDGFNAGNATKFEVLELFGITDKDQAWKDGRYHIATGRLRPEIHELTVDVEHIICTRGDLVRITHDIPQFGLGFARIKTVNGSPNATDIDIDDTFTMEAGKSYTVRIRYDDGTSNLAPINLNVGGQTNVVFTTPITPTIPKVGDLVMFGEVSSESVELLVKEILPFRDLSAKLIMVDHATAVHTAETGTIPAFDSQISLPANPPAQQLPPKPIIESVISDEDALVRAGDGTLESRILVILGFKSSSNIQPAFFQGRFRETNSGDKYTWLPFVPVDAGEVSFSPVEDGESYDLAIRSVSRLGLASEWSEINGHTVIGKSNLPPDVDSFFLEGEIVKWLYPNKPLDFSGFRLRRHAGSNRNWASGISLHEGLVTVTQFDIAKIPRGTQTIMVKAVDTSGNESATAAVIVKDLGEVIVKNVIQTKDYKALIWPGTLTNGVIDGGNDLLADQLTLFWSADNNAPFWRLDPADTFWANKTESMEYTDELTPQTIEVPSKLLLETTVISKSFMLEYRTDTPDLFWIQDSLVFWSTDAATFWNPLPSFVTWPGELDGVTRQKYEFKIKTEAGTVRAKVSKFKAILDVPDVLEIIEDLIIASGGTRLPITKTFRRIKAVSIDLQDDGGSATTAKLFDKNIAIGAGPMVKAFDKAEALTSALIDAQVQGF